MDYFSQKKKLDFGNSGTSIRLITGLIASNNIKATLIGDRSLSSRPMSRVTDHNVREALKIVDYAHIIYNGSLIREGHPSEIVKDEFVKKIYLGQDYQD